MNSWNDPGGGYSLSFPKVTPGVKRLLWILVGVWFATWMLATAAPAAGSTLLSWLGVSPKLWFSPPVFVPIWQPFTYGWFHDLSSPFHLLQNLLILYFFGTLLEGIVGTRRFLTLYIAALVGAGLFSLIAKSLLGVAVPTVGASGAILAVTVAAAVFKPDAPVILLFIPVKLKWLAIGLVALDAIGAAQQIAANYQTPVDHFAHLAGGALGFLFVKRGWIWFDAAEAMEKRARSQRARVTESDEAKLDALLGRIHREGLGSLSEREREFLKRMSDR